METTMYDNLLLLPLFQGLSKNDMTTIIEKVKLDFQSYPKGETIIRQGAPCEKLCFLLNGELRVQTKDAIHAYALTEIIKEPMVIEPQSLFGMQTHYTASYQAHTQVSVLMIDKAFIFSDLNNYEIFRINYLNILSNRNQVSYQKLWNTHIGTINEKFVNFIALRCQLQGGEKILHRLALPASGRRKDSSDHHGRLGFPHQRNPYQPLPPIERFAGQGTGTTQKKRNTHP